MAKRKHYDLIIAWANGAEIEYYSESYNAWVKTKYPSFDDRSEYRIKPEIHIHQELIDAYNQGAKIQFFSKVENKWEDVDNPFWSPSLKYRIKKTPEELYSKFLEKYKQNLNYSIVEIMNNALKDVIKASKDGMFD